MPRLLQPRAQCDTASEPIYEKEKQVASYIANGNSNQEIADALFISLNTVNSHIKSIYSKLGVNSRLQAVKRLQELGASNEARIV